MRNGERVWLYVGLFSKLSRFEGLRPQLFLLTIMSSEEHSETNRINKTVGSFKEEPSSLLLSRAPTASESSIEMDPSSDNLNPARLVTKFFSPTFH